MKIDELETPALVLDRSRLEQNLARMRTHLATLGVPLRPHVKTVKSIDVARLALAGQPGGITVSTLKEAEYFFDAGVRDILYAVSIAPGKLAHAAALIRRGAGLTLVLDNLATVDVVAEAAARESVTFAVLIELDVDGHRSGVDVESDLLHALGKKLSQSAGIELRGVMTHAGGSYDCRSEAALRAMAEQERSRSVRAANRLREIGLPVRVVSVGSTPTALFAQNLAGVTEVRAGVYALNDLVMAGLGVCRIDDIAASVLVSVIGHQPEKGWVITDGGWMALSRDRGTSRQPVDQGYGVVRDHLGRALDDDMIVTGTNQEHGILARRDGGALDPLRYPVGTKLRILPNHACATTSAFSQYHVVSGANPEIVTTWPRIGGW